MNQQATVWTWEFPSSRGTTNYRTLRLRIRYGHRGDAKSLPWLHQIRIYWSYSNTSLTFSHHKCKTQHHGERGSANQKTKARSRHQRYATAQSVQGNQVFLAWQVIMHISNADALMPKAVGGRPSYHGDASSRDLGGRFPIRSVPLVYEWRNNATNGRTKQLLIPS